MRILGEITNLTTGRPKILPMKTKKFNLKSNYYLFILNIIITADAGTNCCILLGRHLSAPAYFWIFFCTCIGVRHPFLCASVVNSETETCNLFYSGFSIIEMQWNEKVGSRGVKYYRYLLVSLSIDTLFRYRYLSIPFGMFEYRYII